MSPTTYAVQLTDANIEAIVEYGAQQKLNLADFRDDMEFNAEDGFDTVAVASIDVEKDILVTITTMTSEGFAASWCMHPSDQYKQFTRVSRR